MRKTLIAISLSLLASGAAGILIATHAVAQPQPRLPVELAQAQAQPLPPARQMPLMGRRGAAPVQAAERRCDNAEALAAGRLAALEVRLKLTPAQTAAFNRWRDVRLAAARKRAETCATMPEGRGQARPSAAERLARQQTRLENRLADIRAERPALEALTSTLSDDQRQILDRAAMGGGRHMMRGMRGRMGMMQRGPMMGSGPGLMGPMGRGRGGDMPLPRLQNPPPPPAQ